MDHSATGRARLLAALCGHNVLLVVHWLAHKEEAVLEDDLGIAEDEVDGTRDGTFAVELTVGVSVQGVLVTIEVAVVEH